MIHRKYTLDDLYTDLNIDEDECEEFREMCHTDFVKVVERINEFAYMDLIPVFESDLQREQDYLDECNEKMFIVFNINGIVLYRKEKLLDDKYIRKGQEFIGANGNFRITNIIKVGERVNSCNAPVLHDTVMTVDKHNRYTTMGLDAFKRLCIKPIEEDFDDTVLRGFIELECPKCHQKNEVKITWYPEHYWFSDGKCECGFSFSLDKDKEDIGKPIKEIKEKYLAKLRSLC